MKKYLVFGGKVLSKDGDVHYINPRKVAQLHGVPMNECVFIESPESDDKLRGLENGNYIHLFPEQNYCNYGKLVKDDAK